MEDYISKTVQDRR